MAAGEDVLTQPAKTYFAYAAGYHKPHANQQPLGYIYIYK
jgi:hypothetical protein